VILRLRLRARDEIKPVKYCYVRIYVQGDEQEAGEERRVRKRSHAKGIGFYR
jgi:hypothetical protein